MFIASRRGRKFDTSRIHKPVDLVVRVQISHHLGDDGNHWDRDFSSHRQAGRILREFYQQTGPSPGDRIGNRSSFSLLLLTNVSQFEIESAYEEGYQESMFERFLALSVLFTLTVSAQVVYFNYSKTGFFATGSWESPDPNVKTGMTETQIDCFRETKTCVMATADNVMGRPHVFTSYLNVMKWDDDGLIATDSSPICMTLTMQVAVADKHITLAHSLKRLATEKAEACKFFGADKTTEDIFVLKGSPRWEKEHQWFPDKTEQPKQHP